MHIVTTEIINRLDSYKTIHFSCEETPLGPVWIASTSYGVCKLTLSLPGELEFLRWLDRTFPTADFVYDGDRHKTIVKSLYQFAAWENLTMEPPLHLIGTEFQLRVWQEVLAIPYGETVSYSELACRLNSHPRAIGQANAKNPIALLIPCHRVVGSKRQLTGYAGGLEMKTKLLELEAGIKVIVSFPPVPSLPA